MNHGATIYSTMGAPAGLMGAAPDAGLEAGVLEYGGRGPRDEGRTEEELAVLDVVVVVDADVASPLRSAQVLSDARRVGDEVVASEDDGRSSLGEVVDEQGICAPREMSGDGVGDVEL